MKKKYIPNEKEKYMCEKHKKFFRKKLVNWKNVKVTEDMVSLQNQSSITLNGIAQGWITDKITALLIENGFNLLEMNNIYLPGTQKFLGYNYWGKATV